MARPITYDPELALERAMELFWSRGYGAVSVDEVVKATGLNRHSLYARYGNKYGLLQAALQRYGAQAVGRIREILDGGATPRERLEALMELRDPERADPFWQQMMDRGCMAHRAATELRQKHPELEAGTRAFDAMFLGMITEVVHEGQESGQFRTDRSAEELASIFVGGFMVPLVISACETRNRAFVAMLS